MKTLKICSLFIFLIIFCFFSGCSKTAEKKIVSSRTELVLGTVCAVNLYEDGTESIYDAIFERLHSIEANMSVNLAHSEITRVNDNAGKQAVSVSPDTLFVVQKALEYAHKSGGVFDPTIGPLVKLWNISGDGGYLPTQAEIDAVLPLVDYTKCHVDEENSTLFLEMQGMKLDVGGIAKGYAADEVVRIASENGVKRALIDLGGNIYALGTKSDSSLWRIGIKDPFSPEGSPIIRLDVENKSVVTSGVYERFFEENGTVYHHILNPKTGYPVHNSLMSVTIISASSIEADALSTSTFILGVDEGVALLESLNAPSDSSAQSVSGIFITDEKKIFASENAASYMTVLNDAFTATVLEP